MTKMTYAIALNTAIACDALSTEVREKLAQLLATQEKRSHANAGKLTTKQIENRGIKMVILNALEDGRAYTITEMIKTVPELNEMNNQRISALVRQMVSDGLVTREEIKRKAYFSKVSVEVEED